MILNSKRTRTPSVKAKLNLMEMDGKTKGRETRKKKKKKVRNINMEEYKTMKLNSMSIRQASIRLLAELKIGDKEVAGMSDPNLQQQRAWLMDEIDYGLSDNEIHHLNSSPQHQTLDLSDEVGNGICDNETNNSNDSSSRLKDSFGYTKNRKELYQQWYIKASYMLDSFVKTIFGNIDEIHGFLPLKVFNNLTDLKKMRDNHLVDCGWMIPSGLVKREKALPSLSRCINPRIIFLLLPLKSSFNLLLPVLEVIGLRSKNFLNRQLHSICQKLDITSLQDATHRTLSKSTKIIPISFLSRQPLSTLGAEDSGIPNSK